MAKTSPPADVLVLGQHPAAYLACILLRHRPSLNVTQICVPGPNWPDRLCLINPAFFELHSELAKLKKKLAMTQVCGVWFLSDKAGTRSEYKNKGTVGCIAVYSELRKCMAELAKDSGAKLINPRSLYIERVDERGLDVCADERTVRGKAALLAGTLADDDARKLALPDPFSAEVMRRYSYVRIKSISRTDGSSRQMIPMSLDLCGQLTWAWMFPGKNEVQLAVEQPIDGKMSPREMLECWWRVLQTHGILTEAASIREEDIQTMEVPAAGALNREGVGNRTLLFGPAGGFFTACLEDIYPNSWSAIFAVDALRKAFAEPHLQDALRPYRESWGTTLGEYLRGPQQNLKFLLPLVYRNPVMTSRLAESILLGKSVVR